MQITVQAVSAQGHFNIFSTGLLPFLWLFCVLLLGMGWFRVQNVLETCTIFTWHSFIYQFYDLFVTWS